MKILLLSTLLWSAFAGGDRERGMQLYKAGKYAEAQAAFATALKGDPESAELQWNLALAAWRAGDLPTAEVAAEKYAANSDDVKEELHRGMLGTIRLAQSAEFEAKADAALAAAQAGAVPVPKDGANPEEEAPDPLALLKTALRKAATAKRHFVRGVRANPTPELLRNTERTLRKIAELEKRIEELEKQKQEEEKKDGDKSPDDKKPDDKGDEEDKKKSDDQKGDQKEDDKKPEDQKGDDKKPGDKKDDKKKPGEGEKDDSKKPDDKNSEKSDPKEGEGEEPQESPEPKPNEEENPEPKPSEQEGKNGESDPNEAEKPENPEPGDEQKEANEGQPPPPPEPKPGEQRNDAPGEGREGLELSPEQAQRLLARAKKLDEQLKKAKARRTTRRRAVERDW